MTIQNFGGKFFATEKDRVNGGGFVGTGQTAAEAMHKCIDIMEKWEPDERQLEEERQYRNK